MQTAVIILFSNADGNSKLCKYFPFLTAVYIL